MAPVRPTGYWSATSATTPPPRDSIGCCGCRSGGGPGGDPHDVRDHLSRRGARRGGAAGAAGDRAAAARLEGAHRRRSCTPRPRTSPRRPEPDAADRRRLPASPPTARSSRTGATSCCATTRGASSTRYPGLEPVGDVTLPEQQQGEGIAVDERRPRLRELGGTAGAVLRIDLPRRRERGAGPPDAEPAPPRPTPVSPGGAELPSADPTGRCGRGCWAAGSGWSSCWSRSLRRRSSARLRLARMPRLRRTSPDHRAGPAAGPGRVRLPRRARRPADRRRSPAVQRPGDPAGVEGRLDHAVRQRAPAGGRHRRRRAAAVPLPPRLADPPRRGEVRPDAGLRQGADRGRGSWCSPTSAARGCRWSGRARSPYACSTSATSGSATTSTPTSTAASG